MKKRKRGAIAFLTFLALLFLPLSTSAMVHHALTSRAISGMELGFFGESTYSVIIEDDSFSVNKLRAYAEKTGEDIAIYRDYSESVRQIAYVNRFAYFPMINGRFFMETDFQTEENYAVIGKNQESNIYEQGGKKYIRTGSTQYEVLGVFGIDDDTMFDDKILVNNPPAEKSKFLNLYYIDCLFKDSDDVYSSLMQGIEQSGFEVSPVSMQKGVMSVILPNILYSRWFILLIFCDFICVFLLFFEWISRKKTEISIKMLAGYSPFQIMSGTCRSYIFLITVSFCLGLILSCLIYPQHIQYLVESVLILIPIIALLFLICYATIKSISIEEALK